METSITRIFNFLMATFSSHFYQNLRHILYYKVLLFESARKLVKSRKVFTSFLIKKVLPYPPKP